jgi:hypothetical protein
MEDCYFYVDWDENIPEEQVKMKTFCLDHAPEGGWLWEGSKQGYGPYTYKCCKCGKVIYQPDEEEKTETTD